MRKTLAPLVFGIIIGAVGLYAYQNADIRSQISEFAAGILNSASDAPARAPEIAVALPTWTATPIQAAPVEIIPAPTVTLTPSPTLAPEQTPTSTATATRVSTPTPIPPLPSRSIEVVSVERLDDGSVDFVLAVKNEGALATEGSGQVEMSVDGGAPELINIIGVLSGGESRSFAFAREFSSGDHIVTFSAGDAATTVNVSVELDRADGFTPAPTLTATVTHTATSVATMTPIPTDTPLPTVPAPSATPLPTITPEPTATPEIAVSPDLRYLEEKRYMLELINIEREEAGLGPIVLGDNVAAQLHAESALENCFSSHWGIDGLKPYMRYSLAGGYQSNGENGLGNRYCIRSSDGFRTIGSIDQEIREAIQSWMDSSGHRRNILGKWHKKVNIGLAWNKYNIAFYQHFEGGYVEYDEMPSIEDGILKIEGRSKNGVEFAKDEDLGVQLYYDPPPAPLTSGQLSKTYCYDSGRPITAFRPPLSGDYYYTEHRFVKSYLQCTDPYDFSADTPAPKPPRGFFQIPEAPQLPSLPIMLDLPWTTAEEWISNGEEFSFRANLNNLISKYGDGVYTVMVWAKLDQQDVVISQYSIFHGVTPPDTYAHE